MRATLPRARIAARGRAATASVFFLLVLVGLVLAPCLLYGQEAELVCGEHGLAVTSHPRATEAAMEMLRKGGNAVDAAVAAAFALGVVEPDASGLGGGGGMVVYLRADSSAHFIDYYGKAPKRVGELMNRDRTSDRHTARSILVPGTVAGLALALEKFGTLPLATVVQPAIRCARDGFALDETLASLLLDNAELLGKSEATASVFLENGFPRMVGDTLKQPELANTLAAIADRGAAGFYEGPVATALVDGIAAGGGVLTLEDLRDYRAVLAAPLRGTYRGCDLISANLPLAGGSVIEAMNILENADLRSMGHYTESPATLHLIAETLRRVYADRTALMGDPDFVYSPIQGIVSKAYAADRFHEIDMASVSPPRYRDTQAGNPARFDKAGAGKAPEPSVKRAKPGEVDDDGDFGRSRYGTWSEDAFDSFGASKKHPSGNARDAGAATPARTKGTGSRGAGRDSVDSREDRPGGLEEAHTTHLSIVDANGNAVSLTQTLGTFFGSTQSVAGVLMNCGMTNFSATGKTNNVEPGKRPRSSISPTIVLKNGAPFLVVGTPGASRITSTMVELLVDLIDFDMDAAKANSAPRFYCSKYEDYLHLESGIGEPVREKLTKMGHSLRVHDGIDLYFGGAHIIRIDPGSGATCGAADPRRSGTAGGD
jgi:gamma-glutamyltranspeptidase / glutathione hydrolase